MCTKNKNRRYSLLTLNPKAENDSKAFWDFRCIDIMTMFRIQLVVVVIYTITYAMAFVDELHDLDLVLYSLLLLMYFVVAFIFVVQKRSPSKFIYTLPLLCAVLHMIDMRRASTDLGLGTLNVQDKATTLGGWFNGETRLYFLFCAFCTPSFKFLLLYYTPLYVCSVVYLILKFGDFEKPAALDTITFLPIYAAFCIACFYVLQ